MGNFQSVTDLTRLMQDVQYTAALRGMTPEQKTRYFESQKEEYITNLLNDREGNFQKVHTDATRNNAIQSSFFFYQQRNRDLNELGHYLKNQNQGEIDSVLYNNQLANRQYEINEWTHNNKKDTLFVFQILFITILLVAGLTYIQRIGFFSPALLGTIVGIILFIDILIIINRSSYTSKVRDQRYWNRRQFPRKDLPQVPGGSTCPPANTEVKDMSMTDAQKLLKEITGRAQQGGFGAPAMRGGMEGFMSAPAEAPEPVPPMPTL